MQVKKVLLIASIIKVKEMEELRMKLIVSVIFGQSVQR